MNRLFNLLIIATLLFCSFSCSNEKKQENNAELKQSPPPLKPLTFAIQPFLPRDVLITNFFPLNDYLSQEIGTQIIIKVTSSYEEHIELVGKDTFDIAYMGPGPYVKMVEKHGEKNLLACLEVNGQPWFHGKIIVKEDSPHQTVKDLNNEISRFALGPIPSTMSHYVPEATLLNEGLEQRFIKNHAHFKHHEDVIKAVLSKKFDAGGVRDNVFNEHRADGIRAIATSSPIATHVILANPALPEEVSQKIKNSLLQLKNTKHGRSILRSIRKDLTGFVLSNDEAFDFLRDILSKHKDHFHEKHE